MERVAAGQPVVALQVERREHLAGGDQAAEAGRDRLQLAHDAIPERLAARRPSRRRAACTARLDEHAHDVASPPRAPVDERRVGQRRDRRLQQRLRPSAAVLRGVVRPLHRIDARRDEDAAAEQRGVVAGGRGTTGRPASARLTLATVPGRPDVAGPPARLGPDAPGRRARSAARFGSMPETTARAVELLAVGEHDAGRPAVARRDARRPRRRSGSRPRRARGRSRAPRASAPGPAPGEDRLARRAAVVAGRVGEQDRGRARRPRTHRRCSGRRARRSSRGARRSRTVRPRSRRSPSAGPAGRRGRRRGRGRGTSGPSRSPASASPSAGRREVGRRLAASAPGSRPAPGRGVERRRRRRRRAPDRARRPAAVRAGSPHSVIGRPSRRGANTRDPGPTSAGRAASSRSRATEARSRPTVCASVGTRTPGAELGGRRPRRRPRPRRSSTSVRSPASREVRGRDQAVVAAADDDRVARLVARHARSPLGRLPAARPQHAPAPRSGPWRP